MSDWVPLVREECLRILKEKKSVWLDCSDVIFVDDRGVEMLKAMAGQGIKLVHCSPFIEGLLREGENP